MFDPQPHAFFFSSREALDLRSLSAEAQRSWRAWPSPGCSASPARRTAAVGPGGVLAPQPSEKYVSLFGDRISTRYTSADEAKDGDLWELGRLAAQPVSVYLSKSWECNPIWVTSRSPAQGAGSTAARSMDEGASASMFVMGNSMWVEYIDYPKGKSQWLCVTKCTQNETLVNGNMD